jgi:uncharacterized protein (DUF433 family)
MQTDGQVTEGTVGLIIAVPPPLVAAGYRCWYRRSSSGWHSFAIPPPQNFLLGLSVKGDAMTSDLRTFLDLPKSILRPLTLDEVAAIVDVDRKVVFRMIKEGDIPKSALSRSKNAVIGFRPMLKPIACPIVQLQVTTGQQLCSQLRRRLVREIVNVAKGFSRQGVFEEGAWRVDLTIAVTKTVSRMAALASAEAAVIFNPDIRGGLPVMRGTRIGVYEAADLCKVETAQYILENFPTLTEEHLEQASLYAKAHPRNKSAS